MIKLLNKNKGFTLIELLIVIGIIGILAIALISAINPIEQIRKSRDTGRLSDARELLGGIQRYSTTHKCQAWQDQAAIEDCLQVAKHPASMRLTTANFNTAFDNVAANTAWLKNLIDGNEIKAQFKNKEPFQSTGLFYLTETAATGAVTVCYEPESAAARTGAFINTTVTNEDGSGASPGTGCAAAYGGGAPAGTCWICVQ